MSTSQLSTMPSVSRRSFHPFNVAILVAALTASGCIDSLVGNGAIVRENRDINVAVTDVSVEDGFQLELNTDPSAIAPSLTIETDSNLIVHAQARIEGNTLRLYNSSHHALIPTHAVQIWLTLPSAQEVHASGGSSANISTGVAPHMELEASGGSEIVLNGEIAHLVAHASGGSRVALHGAGGTIVVQASGGSVVRAASYSALDGELDGSGGSDLDLCVTRALYGELSGGSTLEYYCQPDTVNVAQSGGSRATPH